MFVFLQSYNNIIIAKLIQEVSAPEYLHNSKLTCKTIIHLQMFMCISACMYDCALLSFGVCMCVCVCGGGGRALVGGLVVGYHSTF